MYNLYIIFLGVGRRKEGRVRGGVEGRGGDGVEGGMMGWGVSGGEDKGWAGKFGVRRLMARGSYVGTKT